MRVLILNDYGTPTGGAELQSLRFRDLLRARGHEAMLLTSRARPGGVALAADATCRGTQGPGRRLLQAVNPWAALAVRRTIRAFRPDVVHVRMFMSQLSPLILRELRHTPALLHQVNYQLICPLNTKVLPDGSPCRHRAGGICQTMGCISAAGRARFALQRMMWNVWRDAADMLVTNSRWTSARLAADGVANDGHFTYGTPALGPRPPLGAVPTAAFVGRLFRKKGVDVLLRAMTLVRATIPGARLHIVGQGPEQQALEALAVQLQLSTAVTFHGFVPNEQIPALLGDAWLQVIPSVYEEPFGVVTIEAMMRGTAVIATNAGGPAEVVIEGETGFLTPAGDAPALAGAMIRVLGERALAERLGARAWEIARREFADEASIDRMLAMYEATIERFRQTHP